MTTFNETGRPVHDLREIMIRESKNRVKSDSPIFYRLYYYSNKEKYFNVSLNFDIKAYNIVAAVVTAMDHLNKHLKTRTPPKDVYKQSYDLLKEDYDESEIRAMSEEELVDEVLMTWADGDTLWVEEYTPLTTTLEPSF